MMTKTTQDNGTMQQPKVIEVAVNKTEEVQKWELFNRKASALAASTLVPKEYQGQIANCLIAMEIADRIGAGAFMVMQNLHIIQGRPSWSSQWLIGTVNTCGRFSPLRFRFEGKEGEKGWGCRAVATDLKSGEELVGTLITMELAKEEGWSTKNGSKWRTMPSQMMMYRSAAFWTRTYAPELSLGMLTAEEREDMRASDVPDAITPGNAKDLEAQLRGVVETPAAPDSKPKDGDGESYDAATGEVQPTREPGEEG